MPEENKNKPLLLFAPIYDFVAQEFVDKMNDIPEDEDINIWINSPGGRVFAGWSIIGAMEERKGKINCLVLGHAASMSFYFPLFSDYAEALEVTRFMIHRAEGYVENEDEKILLNNMNKDLKAQMQKRLNMDIFKETTGVTIDDIFDPEKRVEVWIDAKQAKKIGLINKIKKFEQKELKAYNDFVAFADFSQRSEELSQRSDAGANNNNNKNLKTMTLQEFKAQHPEIYSQVFDIGCEAGKKAEQVRVKSWIAYLDVDKENVITSIKENKDFTPDVMAEMSVKMQAKMKAGDIEDDSQENINTQQADDKTAQQKEVEAFEKEVTEGVKQINIY